MLVQKLTVHYSMKSHGIVAKKHFIIRIKKLIQSTIFIKRLNFSCDKNYSIVFLLDRFPRERIISCLAPISEPAVASTAAGRIS